MTIPGVRFTVKRMMVAVAMIGLSIYGCVLWQRSAEFARRSELYRARVELEELESIGSVSLLLEERGEGRPVPPARDESGFASLESQSTEALRRLLARFQRVRDHYAALSAKYRRAARYPFLPVPPDPPEPE